ncbi:hypothetical protein L613_000400000320 [Pseudoxanthomonas taiwanensis J19]|uniref:Uncharacterized protein n=1 Tax=Pseudoxanthomonas taiwanensis J19 TaxID=935569 RepID=A0A562DI76_9GAMM|nr:hypothetical protein L613_000400000320 [Pseudoxanthomonas taiwanensis J19]
MNTTKQDGVGINHNVVTNMRILFRPAPGYTKGYPLVYGNPLPDNDTITYYDAGWMRKTQAWTNNGLWTYVTAT